jgi:hypothetical protein
MRCYNGMYGECLRAMGVMSYRTCEMKAGVDIRLMTPVDPTVADSKTDDNIKA